MASTYTPLGVELQATGENAGTWGTKTNTNLPIELGKSISDRPGLEFIYRDHQFYLHLLDNPYIAQYT